MASSQSNAFDLTGRVAVITGGAGLLGRRHAEAIAAAGGIPVLADLRADQARAEADQVRARFGVDAMGIGADVTSKSSVAALTVAVLDRYGRVDILVNNAANDPKVTNETNVAWSRIEHFSLEAWSADLAVGLTGAFLCAQSIGTVMAERGAGVIINISSDLGLIAPDQRIYTRPELSPHQQPAKPVSYSVVKTGLLGLTRYLATYWADRGVRVNALCPGGVDAGQPQAFKSRVESRIPLGRLARTDEYQAAILFLASDASSYMTGANLVIDGGRTIW